MATATVTVPFVDLQSHHRPLAQELHAAFTRVMDRSSFILGEEVAQFEREFAVYVGSAEAVGVSSGLDALRLSLVALGVGEGDEVILPANTYIATALAVSACGARPVLVDVEERTFGLAPDLVQKAITPRTKAIIPVHLYGQPCQIDRVMAVAKEAGLAVVEDACQAHGARTDDNRACGTIGDAGCFSFYPSKNLGAFGDGGMVVTNRRDIADRLRLLRDYGQERKYHHVAKGFNSRLDGLQAALLRVKLPHLDEANTRRAKHAATYARGLAASGIQLPEALPAPSHIYHLYVIRTSNRDGLMKHLSSFGIQTGIHYPIPIHQQPAYADLGYRSGAFPVTERLAGEILSLPMYPELTTEQVQAVISAVDGFVAGR
ncbi:MAG TPA: DegT/DnrJ/EryC1/StrS family aminotransferase [Vicinamibacterales bacterium]|jgi:dTDP-4-amino-4,6-dideoxygalactose transaminase|nr:DegT/DnrJ/EryC1/StrS family aminotransferase [Vicinamibacterales bacterium]